MKVPNSVRPSNLGSAGGSSWEHKFGDLSPLEVPKCVLPSDLGSHGGSGWEYTFLDFMALKVPKCVLLTDVGMTEGAAGSTHLGFLSPKRILPSHLWF